VLWHIITAAATGGRLLAVPVARMLRNGKQQTPPESPTDSRAEPPAGAPLDGLPTTPSL